MVNLMMNNKQTKISRVILPALALLLVLISLSCLIFGNYSSLFREYVPKTITLTNEGADPAGRASELWLSVMLDGSAIPPEELLSESTENSGWTSRDGYLLSTGFGDTLTVSVDASSDLVLCFDSHVYAGRVKIVTESIEETYNIYSETATKTEITPWKQAVFTHNWTMLILVGILITSVWILISMLFIKNKGTGFLPAFLLAWVGCTAFAWHADHLNGTFCIILIVSAGSAFVLYRHPVSETEKYKHGLLSVLVCLLAFYFSFALAGNGLFLMESRMTVTYDTVSYLILFCIMLHPVTLGIVVILDLLMHKAEGLTQREKTAKIWRIGLLCGGIVWVVNIFFSLGFYPATMTQDGITHWLQSQAYSAFTDDNPVIYSLLIRWLSYIAPTQYTYVIFQISLFSFVVGKLFAYLYEKGVHVWLLVLSSFFVAFAPNVFITMTLMSKNPLFSILNVWVIILLSQLMDDPKRRTHSIFWLSEMTVAMTGLYLIRKNNFPGYYLIIAFFIYQTIHLYRKAGLRLIGVSVLSLIMVWAINNPLYAQYEIYHIDGSSFPYTPIVTPFASAAVNDLELPDDILEDMDQIIPLEQWDDRYNPYHSDVFAWGDPLPNYKNMTPTKAMKNYLRLLAMYPDVVIKDRLDGVESIWNIFPCTAGRAYNERFHYGININMPTELLPEYLQNTEPTIKASYFKENLISKIAFAISSICEKNPMFDAVIWRNGIYIVLVLSMFVVLWARKRTMMIWIFLPTLAIFATLIFVIGWQLYQYIFFFPMAAVAFTACALVSNRAVPEKMDNVKDAE